MFWTLTVFSACGPSVHEFDLHGQAAVLQSGSNGWAYFGSGYGDFGHTIDIHAFINGKEIDVYHMKGNDLLSTNESEKISSPFFADHISQHTIFGVNAGAEGKSVVVTYESHVKPIHPNSAATLVYSLFVFFACNFIIAGVFQFFFFRNAINPNEYNFDYSQQLNT